MAVVGKRIDFNVKKHKEMVITTLGVVVGK